MDRKRRLNMQRPGMFTGVFLLAALAGGPTGAGDPSREIRIGLEKLRILEGGAPLLEYRHGGENLFKPYVAGLFLEGGVNPFRDSPHDHQHHHALMLAFNVGGVEFWGVENENCGRQVHLSYGEIRGPDREGHVAFTDRLEWRAPAGKVLLLEDRRLSLVPGAPAARLLDWDSTFRLPPGASSTQLTGREYHGLGVRFLQSMDSGGKLLNSEGGVGVEGTNEKRARWCAYSGRLPGGKWVTVALFGHPENPRSPADWFTMTRGFAYMTLTISLDEKPLELNAGKQLRLRQGVAVMSGEATGKAIQEVYDFWLQRRS